MKCAQMDSLLELQVLRSGLRYRHYKPQDQNLIIGRMNSIASVRKFEVDVTIDEKPLQLSFYRRETKGPELVFLHGLQSNKEMFAEMMQAAPLSRFSILAVDFIGFGESSKPKDFNYDLKTQTNTLFRALRQLTRKKVILVGHSVGGMIATLSLDHAPEEIQAVMSFEGNLTEDDCGESRNIAALSAHDFERTYPEFLKKIRSSNPATGEVRAQWLQSTPPFVLHRTSQSILSWASTRTLKYLFETSPIPKLLVKGGDSAFKTNPKGPNTSVKIMDGTSHFMILENPAAAIEAILEFTEGLR